jgi:hydrogenase maturation factor
MTFPLGKLPNDHLAPLLARYATPGPKGSIIIGARIGEDAAVLDIGAQYLVATTDPITFATDALGWYAVQVNANDIATRGAAPAWFLATILLPEGFDAARVEDIFVQIAEACRAVGCDMVGGHTEITFNLDRPIVVGTMLGLVAKDKLVTTSGAQVGDDLILTKGIPLEGTSLLAREKAETLRARGYSRAFIERAQNLLFAPGIGITREAKIATDTARVHAMHDPTEGGLATGLWELARAANVTLEIERAEIPLVPEGERICAEFGVDPLGTIASGALLLATAPEDTPQVLSALTRESIAARVIGHVVGTGAAVRWRVDDQYSPLPEFGRDEITRVL